METRLDPFRGVRYDLGVVGAADGVIAPPYDVIGDAQRQELLARSPYNIARIIRADSDDDYARVADTLKQWRKDRALTQDDTPAVYVYEQRFDLGGREYRRTGMIGLVTLNPEEGSVVPHERTLSGPKADRLNLLRATHMTFGQIFVLYSDPKRTTDPICDEAKAGPCLLEAEDTAGIGHRLWAMTDADAIHGVQEALADQPLFIADGHHRWETACDFLRESPSLPGASRRMMTLVNTSNPGLAVLPIHRVVKNVDFNVETLLAQLSEDFEVVPFEGEPVAARRELVAAMARTRQSGAVAIGMFLSDGRFRLAALRNEGSLSDVAPALRGLGVAVLHRLILDKALGIDAAKLATGAHVEYVTDMDGDPVDAVAKVERGEGQAAFFVGATTPEEVKAVASAGERMPQKCTFFYPKVYTGLVMQDLESD